MESGHIDVADLAGPFDLQSTLESGQSYCWWRADGDTYTSLDAHGGDAWYETVTPAVDGVTEAPTYLRARQTGGVDDGTVEWEAARVRPVGDGAEGGIAAVADDTDGAIDAVADVGVDATDLLTHLLRLDDDLAGIYDATPDDPLVGRAYDRFRGMRLVRDPVFPCLISFICSAQMRVARIHGMQLALRRAYGDEVAVGDDSGTTVHAFPRPEQLAATTEDDLRELSLGYRAPYVRRTAEMVADGEADPAEARPLDYEAARDALTRFVGVGEKVADCVLLFSLDFLEAVPLDTWIRSAIADHYPDCDRGNYAETSRAIRERFGGEYAGYAQTYVFHHLRTGGEE